VSSRGTIDDGRRAITDIGGSLGVAFKDKST
jgi:hypothetical protein